MRLLAADQGKRQQRANEPDRQESTRRASGQRRWTQRPQSRQRPAEGPQEQGQHGQEEPERPLVRKGRHHPPRALPPQDLGSVFLAAQDQRRHQPQRHKRKRRQDRQPDTAIPAPGRQFPPGPERRGQRDRQDMDQDHRSLGIDPKRNGRAEREERGPAVRPSPCPKHRQHRPQRRHRQNRIEHRGRAEQQKHRRDRQDQRRPGRPRRISGPQAPCQQPGQRHRRHREGRRDQPRAQRRDTAHQPDQIDQPEQQRRLLRIERPVQMRHQRRSALIHLPGGGDVARLVDRRQRAQQDQRQHRQREQQRRGPDGRSHAPASARLRTWRRIRIRLRV